MFSQVGTVGGFIKLDVGGGVDSIRKLWIYILDQVDAVGLIDKEIVITFAIGEPPVVQHNVRAIRKDSETQSPRVKGDGDRSLGP